MYVNAALYVCALCPPNTMTPFKTCKMFFHAFLFHRCIFFFGYRQKTNVYDLSADACISVVFRPALVLISLNKRLRLVGDVRF